MKRKLLTLLLATAALATSCTGKGKTYDLGAYISTLNTADVNEFVICEWNDLHIANTTDIDRQISYLNNVIDSYGKVTNKNKQPDLIVLNGDVFMEANKSVITKFLSWLDSKNIPFAYTYGNHDLQGQYSNSFVDEAVKACRNSVLKNPIDDDVYGDANYVVNIKQNDKTKWQVYVFDSNTYYNFGYDNIHDDQVEWYKKEVQKATDENGGTPVPSLAFFHIPTEDFADAWKQKGNTSDGKGTDGEFWHMGEGVSSSKLKTKLYSAIVEKKSTKGIICAHDHVNLTDFHYKGPNKNNDVVRLIFGLKTGDGIYHDENYMGASFYELKDGGNFNMVNVRVDYKGEATLIKTK